jgi:hypothetical protein
MKLSEKRNAALKRKPLSETDQSFEEAHPNYYQFGKQTFERKCLRCGRWFETTLDMLRFCSHHHMQLSLATEVRNA